MFSDRELKIIYRDFKCNKGRNFLTFREKKKKKEKEESYNHFLISYFLHLSCLLAYHTGTHVFTHSHRSQPSSPPLFTHSASTPPHCFS